MLEAWKMCMRISSKKIAETRDRLHLFQEQHSQQLTMMALFHIEGNPYSKERGKGEVIKV